MKPLFNKCWLSEMELHTSSILFPIRYICLGTDDIHEFMVPSLGAGTSWAPIKVYAIFSLPILVGLL